MAEDNPISEIRLLITGGTIDKSYCPVEGALSFSRTHVLAMLKQARVALPEDKVQTLLLKDSLDLTEADREVICQAASITTETKLIITHGTDTMVQTAERLAAKHLAKTVVLVGAMVPYTFSTRAFGNPSLIWARSRSLTGAEPMRIAVTLDTSVAARSAPSRNIIASIGGTAVSQVQLKRSIASM